MMINMVVQRMMTIIVMTSTNVITIIIIIITCTILKFQELWDTDWEERTQKRSRV